MKLIKAEHDDAQTLWEMQREAFSELLEKYRDYETSPAAETLERMLQRLSDGSCFYFIIADGKKVGALRVITKDNRKRLSPIFIMKQYRGKGLAQEAIRLAEQIHGEHDWELSTILQEQGNCHLYEKLGYRRTGKIERINERMDIVYYEKD